MNLNILGTTTSLYQTSSNKKMTVKIDMTNPNPETSVTYADDAIEMSAGSSDWDTFFGHYPVYIINGVEHLRLKETDFGKAKDSGLPANIGESAIGDVMIAFPRRGIKIETVGDILTVSMTDIQDAPDFKYYAHKKGTINKDKFFIGAYKGYVKADKLRSVAGVSPSLNSLDNFRTFAGNMGSDFKVMSFYQLLFIQVMYILKYKSLNSQEALGKGYTVSNPSMTNTGETFNKGMDYGESTGKEQVKLFGIEDLWGNINEWIDGIKTGNDYSVSTSMNNTVYWVDLGTWTSSNLYGAIKRVDGTTETGFLISQIQSTANYSSFFCDFGQIQNNSYGVHGGSYSHNISSGIFRFTIDFPKTDPRFNARLMML